MLCFLALPESCGSKNRISHQCWSVLISRRALVSPLAFRGRFLQAMPVIQDREMPRDFLLPLHFSSSVITCFLDHCPILFSFLFSTLLLPVPPFSPLNKLSILITTNQEPLLIFLSVSTCALCARRFATHTWRSHTGRMPWASHCRA